MVEKVRLKLSHSHSSALCTLNFPPYSKISCWNTKLKRLLGLF